MFKRLSLFFTFLFLFQYGYATSNDSISTRYNKGVFNSYCQLSTSANDSVANAVVNQFVHQMCYDIKGLFKWGLKGMSLKNEKDELLVFDFKRTVYSKQTGILKGIGDVIVPGVTTINDVSVDSKLTIRTYTSGKREVKLDLAKSNLFIKSMSGSFYFVPKGDNKTGYFQIRTNISFSWFFDVFITQKRYQSIMEWRLRQVMLNLREEAEKRSH